MRRVLLSIAGSSFDGAFADQPLEFAPDLGRRLVAALADHGYAAEPPSGHVDLDADGLGAAVEKAVREAGPDDLLIVHVIGHGIDRNGTVLMVGADGRATARTSVTSWMLDAAGDDEDEDPERRHGADAKARVLFLIDVCYAGRAARQAFDQHIDDERRRAWVVAGCLPRRSGYNGHFTEALIGVLGDLGHIDQHFSFPYVPLTSVVRAVRRQALELAKSRGSYPQQVIATRVDLGAVVDVPFFLNPAHKPSLMGAVPAEFRDLVAAVDPLVDPWHFASRASGRQIHPGRLMPGTFHGRGEQLRRLTAWLAGDAGTPLMVVTGSPGVGKSAAIGMLVCAGHPRLVTVTDKLWWDRRADLPAAPRADLAVVHARERGLAEILGSVARQLGLTGPGREWTPIGIREAMLARDRPPVLVLDALDETVDPVAVLAAIGALSAAAGDRVPCRLLVGTRAGRYWPAFEPLCAEAEELGSLVDLDAEDRGELQGALAGYVDDLLRTDAGYGASEMVPTRRFLAGHVAEVLSAPVAAEGGPRWGEFLVAGVYVNHLVRSAVPDEPGAARVPRTLPEVLDLDLSGRTSAWLLPVLKVVAHAFGAGVPLEVIEVCCAAFAERADTRPARQDVVAALWEARFYLRRDHEPDGTTLYRLFHQALSDHLQQRTADELGDRAGAHRKILDSVRARGGVWDATITPPYLLRHSADHAAAADRIDELLVDPHFLIHAEPAHLSRHLRRATTAEGRTAAAIYRTSLYHHLRREPEARRGLLALDAARHGQRELSRRLAEVTGDLPTMGWRPAWSTGGQSSSLLHVLPTGSEITATTLTTAGSRQYATLAGQDGLLRLWDLVDGTSRAVRTTGSGPVIHAFPYACPDGPMLVTVGRNAQVTAWTVPDATLYSRTELGCEPTTAAVHLAFADGSTHVILGDREGHLHGAPVARPGEGWTREAHAAEVTALAATVLADGSPVVVSADRAGDVRVWDVVTGDLRLHLEGYPDWVGGIACHRNLDGSDVAVVTGGGGTAVVWDLLDGRVRHKLRTAGAWTAPAACATVPGIDADVVVLGGEQGTAEVRDLRTGEVRWTLHGHRSWLGPAICTTLADGATVAITASGDGTARLWDLATGAAREVLTGHADSVTGTAHLTTEDGTDLVLSYGLDGHGRVWDVTVSPDEMSSRTGHLDTVTAVAAVGPYLVSGGRDGSVLRWGAATGKGWGAVHTTENPILAVAAGASEDGLVIVSGDLAGVFRRSTLTGRGTGRINTATEQFAPAILAIACSADPNRSFRAVICDSWGSRIQFRPGPEEDFDVRPASGTHVNAVAWLRLADGTPVILTSTAGPSASVWDVRTADLRYWVTDLGSDVTSIAGLSGPDGFIVLGGADGEVRCRRLADGEPLRSLTGHTEAVTAVACATDEEGWVVAAAAADGVIRVWRAADSEWPETVTMPEVARSLCFTPDGGLVAGYGWEVARFDRYRTQSAAVTR
ncbi:hypothetical protein ACQP2F_18770 [Actinoplanes sp. CA-030573]|uniref:hypothetical protein n=1 Tax=Actinoplanes sp. CA-030573 TaxID=3239898 RepID=UPI003D8DBF4E